MRKKSVHIAVQTIQRGKGFIRNKGNATDAIHVAGSFKIAINLRD